MNNLKTLALILFSILFLFGCNTVGVGVQGPIAPVYKTKTYHKPGPPPHAPAHGYRHKHHRGHEMRYDSNIGAYVVLNIPETYFGNNFYIRMSTDGRWLVSTTLSSYWRVAVGNEVPPRLRAYKTKKVHHKYKKRKKEKGYEKVKKGKGHKKNKYGYDDDNDYDYDE